MRFDFQTSDGATVVNSDRLSEVDRFDAIRSSPDDDGMRRAVLEDGWFVICKFIKWRINLDEP